MSCIWIKNKSAQDTNGESQDCPKTLLIIEEVGSPAQSTRCYVSLSLSVSVHYL